MRAKKSLGQNFLQDASVIQRIVEALDLKRDEVVVEIGPGQGALTKILLLTGAKVAAVEFDRDLLETLNTKFSAFSNFELIHADALQFDFSSVCQQGKTIKLAANLPYNISTPILQRLIEEKDLFNCLVLMFQREVVERITAKPGSSERGFLTVITENSFDIEYLFHVPPEAFRPVPKVWSSVVRLTPKSVPSTETAILRRIVITGFAQKRKTILNNLKTVYHNASEILAAATIDPSRRAETLTLAEWARLAETVSLSGDRLR